MPPYYEDDENISPFQKALNDALGVSTQRQEELMSERGELQSQFSQLVGTTPEEERGGWASMVLPFLAGMIGGKDSKGRFGLGLQAAGTSGQLYWNNLAQDEAKKEKLILDKMNFNQQQSLAEQNRFQQLTGFQLNQAGDMETARAKGQLPNTPEWRAQEAADLNRSIAVANASARASNPPLDPTVLNKINQGAAPGEGYAPGVTAREVGVAQRQQQLDLLKGGEARRKLALALQTSSRMRSGIAVNGLGLTESDAKQQAIVMAGKESFNTVLDMMGDLIKTKGVDFLGPDSPERAAIISRGMDAYRSSAQAGANFTEAEMNLALARMPAFASLFDTIAAKARGYGDTASMLSLIENEKARNITESASRLLPYKGIVVGHKYTPEQMKQYGIKTDKNGLAVDSGETQQFINSLLQDVSMIDQGVSKSFGDDSFGPATVDDWQTDMNSAPPSLRGRPGIRFRRIS